MAAIENTNVIDTMRREALDELIIGQSPTIRQLKQLILKAAASDSAILIEGDSGTGKELVARALHQHSPRSSAPFIVINCANLQEQLLESELFGHRRGAFTGASQNKPGLFEVADGGMLFMDEIGEIPLAQQAKLLRVLETMEFLPVGDTQPVQVDVRIIAAANRSLQESTKEGTFRADLYYRLSVVTLEVPPLRNRCEDIPELVEHFLKNHGLDGKVRLTEDAIAHLIDYHWPGNIRELFNTLERSLIFRSGDELSAESIYIQTRTAVPLTDVTEMPMLDQVIRNHIIRVLTATGNNKTQAARILGVQRRQLYRLLEAHNININTPR
ncbi:MAG: sigma-54 dependent transcriptional regulator [Candidatus Poribacteria bacterium]|nr:sigma-54 dependent transcriptional regulator [Candidatus Poribacteria bacterium]